MSEPKPDETRGVPWGDHNPTETSPPDRRREEYGDQDPSENADERAREGDDQERVDQDSSP